MRSLENTATIYVPTETEAAQDLVSKLADEAARIFGGSTMTQGVGRYVRKDGTMEAESVTLVTFSAKQETDRKRFGEFVLEAVRNIGRLLKQETVLASVNGYLGLYEAEVDYFLEEGK